MKKRHIYIATLFIALLSFSACNDEWKDELYVHMVSLKAPINDGEVSSIYVRYKPNGEVIYNLPVLVSGSTPLDKDLDVRIAVDPDTLNAMNEANFHELRKDLWYNLLPQENYEFPSATCHIPAGSRKELFPIKFKFSEMNLSKEWVLPLTIEEDPSYITNKRKGWRKALLHVLPFNDYSGNYSATAMNIYFADSSNDPLVVDNRRAHVVDENTVFFYAGTKEDNAIDRETYKINVKFDWYSGRSGWRTGRRRIRSRPAAPSALHILCASPPCPGQRLGADRPSPHSGRGPPVPPPLRRAPPAQSLSGCGWLPHSSGTSPSARPHPNGRL